MDTHLEDTLAEWLQRRGTAILSFQELTSLVWQAALALQSVHNRRLVYQNVSPTCFLVRERREHAGLPTLQLVAGGSPVAVDRLPGMDSSLTNAPIYRAPEQWQGMAVFATDQYALAVLAYQLLTGRAPFQGTWQQVKEQHFSLLPEPPSRFNPRIPPAVDKVILRALARKPQDRFPSVSAFAGALEQALLPSAAPTLQQRPPVTAFPPRYQQTAQPLPRLPSAFKELALLGIVFVLVVSGIVFGLSSIARNNQAASASIVASAFIDPLNKNVDGSWLENTNCVFRSGTYHVLATPGKIGLCALRKVHFSNDAILVDVSLLVGGDTGLLFDINDQHGQLGFYAFFITSRGYFALYRYNDANGPGGHISTLIPARSTRALFPGQQRNTLLIDASRDSSFLLAINGVDVGKVQDKQGAFSSGEIGFAVNLTSSALHGDASFSNLAVLPL